jgi:hypothetical protein
MSLPFENPDVSVDMTFCVEWCACCPAAMLNDGGNCYHILDFECGLVYSKPLPFFPSHSTGPFDVD